jgi:ArsR family transcriptional regulator
MNTTRPSLLADPDRTVGLCCAPVTAGTLPVEDAEQLARRFKALGDPTRVRLLSMIAATPGGEACICDLTEPVGLSQPTVSHHMKILAEAGLVHRQQRGRWAYFTIDQRELDAVAKSLTTGRGRHSTTSAEIVPDPSEESSVASSASEARARPSAAPTIRHT